MASPKVEGFTEEDPNDAAFRKLKGMGFSAGKRYIGIIDGDLVGSGDNYGDLVINISQLASNRGSGTQWRIFDSEEEGTNKSVEYNEPCLTGRSLPIELTVEQIKEYFPDAYIANSGGQYADSKRRSTVIIYDRGDHRFVRRIGPCPNFPLDDGVCTRGSDCFRKHDPSV